MDWVFQYNPAIWDKLEQKSAEPNDWWWMRSHRDIVSIGDRVFFWRTEPAAGLTAIGYVTSPAYPRTEARGGVAVDVRFASYVVPPLSRSEILQESDLASIAIFRGWQGTNFRLNDSQAAALDKLLAGRFQQITSKASATSEKFNDLGEALRASNTRTRAALRSRVQKMNPKSFESLVARVLDRLGYQATEVTPYSGDKGIDIDAVFLVGGVTPIHVGVQVKRTPSVGPGVVQAVRGATTSHDVALIVTSGTFTDGARKEAALSNSRVGLIDIEQLIDIMIEKGVGIRRVQLPILKLLPEASLLEDGPDDVADPVGSALTDTDAVGEA